MRVLMCPYGLSHQTDGPGSLRGSIRIKHLIFDSRLLSALRWGFQRDYMPQREGMHCLLFTWQSHTHSPSRCAHRPLYTLLFAHAQFLLTSILKFYSCIACLCTHITCQCIVVPCAVFSCLSSYWRVCVCVWNRLYINSISFCIWTKQLVVECLHLSTHAHLWPAEAIFAFKCFWEVSA